MSPFATYLVVFNGGAPRVSGDEPMTTRPMIGMMLCSPRERG